MFGKPQNLLYKKDAWICRFSASIGGGGGEKYVSGRRPTQAAISAQIF